MKTADIDKFWVLPFAGYIFNSPEECDGRIRHDLIKCVDVDELKDLIDEMIGEIRKPCEHTGCYNHITHPCEGCGRVRGQITQEANEALTELKAKL
jgi:hypothetical protein